MRFKKGSKVEVMNKKEVPISWRSAKILSGNGHTCSVRYDYQSGLNSGSLMERVSRKLVRPCPPPSPSVVTREVGETVDVFEDLSWKTAIILKVMSGDYYTVRFLGCSMESIAHKLYIRDQLLWLNDKWIMMGKKSGTRGLRQFNNPSTSKFYQKTSFKVAESDAKIQNQAQKNCSEIHKKTGFQQSHKVSSRSLKKMSPYWSSVIESHASNSQKTRAVEKDGRRQKVGLHLVVEKVDAVAYSREVLDESYMHTSFDSRINGYNEPKRRKLNGTAGFYLPGNLEPNDSDSDASSVGSCSAISARQKGSSHDFAQVPRQESDSICSDAESSSDPKDDEESCSVPLAEDEVARSIHDIELHAYRCTLAALHASGPLSWELESLLTNLRTMLHVSNDEHLMEIRTNCGAMHPLLPVVTRRCWEPLAFQHFPWYIQWDTKCIHFLADDHGKSMAGSVAITVSTALCHFDIEIALFNEEGTTRDCSKVNTMSFRKYDEYLGCPKYENK